MPLYEGLSSVGLMNEKLTTVVFDFGVAFTKLGFAGETGPHSIIRSEVTCRKTGMKVSLFKFKDKVELRHHLVDFIHMVYFRHLLVNPKDRRVVIVENIMGSSVIRDTLASVLFRHYEVLSILFLPSALSVLMSLGIPNGLVIDVGYDETSIMPVVEGVVLLKSWHGAALATKAVQRSLNELLLERCICVSVNQKDKRLSSLMDQVPLDVLEDISVRCCFTSTVKRSEKLHPNMFERSNEPPPPAPAIQYPLNGDVELSVPGTVREMASECLFIRDADQNSLQDLVLKAIMESPIDVRCILAENLVIVGGLATMIGFKHRLLSEIKLLSQKSPYCDKSKIQTFKVHDPPAKNNYVSWLGGSLLGCTESCARKSLHRDIYFQSPTMCEWGSLLFNKGERTTA